MYATELPYFIGYFPKKNDYHCHHPEIPCFFRAVDGGGQGAMFTDYLYARRMSFNEAQNLLPTVKRNFDPRGGVTEEDVKIIRLFHSSFDASIPWGGQMEIHESGVITYTFYEQYYNTSGGRMVQRYQQTDTEGYGGAFREWYLINVRVDPTTGRALTNEYVPQVTTLLKVNKSVDRSNDIDFFAKTEYLAKALWRSGLLVV